MKHPKSAALNTGAAVDPSQFALASPAAYRFTKHTKSFTFSAGAAVDASQLA